MGSCSTPNWYCGTSAQVYTLITDGSDLFLGGDFTTAGGGTAWNFDEWNVAPNSYYPSGPVYAFAVDGGNLVLGGNFTQLTDVFFNTQMNYIAEWNVSGSYWQAELGTGMNGTVKALAVYGGNIYAGGSYGNGPGTWGNNAAPYLMEYNGPIGINELKETNAITVFPNPSTGVFTFQFSQSELVEDRSTIDIYNMLGEKVYAAPLNFSKGTSTTISLSDYSAGIYLYRITTKDGNLVSTGKLIKE